MTQSKLTKEELNDRIFPIARRASGIKEPKSMYDPYGLADKQ